MTFAEMQADVRRRINESATTFFTDQDVKDAINDGYAEISDATEWYEREATIALLKNRSLYNLKYLLPDTFLSLRRCWNTTTQRWLEPAEPRDLDNHGFRQWETMQGQPESYMIRGHWWLCVWLKSAADARGLRIYYTAIPSALSNDADTPAFPSEFHYGLVEYAISDLHAQQRETKKAMAHWNNYLGYEDGLRTYADKRQSIDRVHVL